MIGLGNPNVTSIATPREAKSGMRFLQPAFRINTIP